MEDALINSDAAIFLTDWEDYKNINWSSLYKLMRVPGWVFDCRAILSRESVLESNLNYWRLGDGSNK